MDIVRWVVGVPLLVIGLVGTVGNLYLLFGWYILKQRFTTSSAPLSSLLSVAGFFPLPLSMDMKLRIAIAAGLLLADVSTCVGLPWFIWQAIRGFPADREMPGNTDQDDAR